MKLYNVREINIYDTNGFQLKDIVIVYYAMLILFQIIFGIILFFSSENSLWEFYMEVFNYYAYKYIIECENTNTLLLYVIIYKLISYYFIGQLLYNNHRK